VAAQMVEVQGAILIVPTALTAETILPDIPTPSFPRKENSPLLTDGGGENVKVAEVPHETLISMLL
jgi:hypothetical protein